MNIDKNTYETEENMYDHKANTESFNRQPGSNQIYIEIRDDVNEIA